MKKALDTHDGFSRLSVYAANRFSKPGTCFSILKSTNKSRFLWATLNTWYLFSIYVLVSSSPGSTLRVIFIFVIPLLLSPTSSGGDVSLQYWKLTGSRIRFVTTFSWYVSSLV